MTVAELIAQLRNFPPHDIVVMSKDGEGNSYSPLSGLDMAKYVAESTWEGFLLDEDDEDEDEELKESAVPCVVFWPTN